MAWAPRCALLPLGSVRGEEGLTTWEYVAFAEACENRYRSGDDEQEEEEEACFLFHEALAAEEAEAEISSDSTDFWGEDLVHWEGEDAEQENEEARFGD